MNLLKRLFGVGCDHNYGEWIRYKCGSVEGIHEGKYRICSKCGYRDGKE